MPLRVVTVAGAPEAEAAFATALARRTDAEIVLRCVDRVELLAAIRGATPDLVVCVGSPSWLDRQSCDEAVAERIPVVGLACSADDGDAFARLGILVLPADAEIDRVLGVGASGDALPEAPAALARSLGETGRLIAVWGPKGAPGRSTIAAELAAELAHSGATCALVDADTYGGDLAQMLGVVEELPTIVWACRAAARPDADPLEGIRRTGPRGPALIAGIPRSDLWKDIGDFGWRELLARLRAAFDHVVVDIGFSLEDPSSPLGGDGRNHVARAAVREADRVVAVCRCDPVGLKTFLWSYPALAELVAEDRVVVCANRVAPGEEGAAADLLRRHARKRPAAYLPDEPATFRAAVAKGVPARDLAPGSAAARAVRGLAAALGGAPRPTGVFARLAGRA
ncbi:MAG TPA: P-loop NTPase [Actinomycetota bacterium]|nr:P-loop NTPase [Actinomycetota bacterium]